MASPDDFWKEDIDEPIKIEFYDWFGFRHDTYFGVLTQPIRDENALLKYRLKNNSLSIEQLMEIDSTIGINPESAEVILECRSIIIREYDILGKQLFIKCMFDIDEPYDKMPDSVEEFTVTIKHVFITKGDTLYEH